MLGCQRLSRAVKRVRAPFREAHPVIRTRSPACGHPRGRLWRSLYPNPIHSDTSCRETAARSGGDSDTARRRPRRSHALPGPARRLALELRSHHAGPTPAKGRSLRARSPAHRHHARAWTRCTRRSSRRVASPPGSGPRAASPALPRRRTRSAAPEVPSIDETGHRHPDTRPFGHASGRPGVGTSPIFTREWYSPQAVANLGTTPDAFFNLAVSTALDGAMGRRPGCASCT
jgi:hypothetical protein